MRFITNHSGSTLTLIRQLDSLSEAFAKQGYGQGYGYGYGGLVARIFPGCDRTTQTCKDKFDNLNNNGAFPFIPLKNPMSGSSIV
jgi:GH24 family phage-related lysozyme (muramidase)